MNIGQQIRFYTPKPQTPVYHHYEDVCPQEEMGTVTEIHLDHIEHNVLRQNLNLTHYDAYLENSCNTYGNRDFKEIANEMVNQHIQNNNNSKIQQLRDYFEHADTMCDPIDNKIIFENREDPLTSQSFDRERQYVKGYKYDPATGRMEVNIETYIYSINDVPFVSEPNDLKWKLKQNLVIHIKSRAEPIYNAPLNERNAIDTLREMITEIEFRKYVKHGFILVKGNSGDIYQVFRNRDHTKVWRKGQMIKEVCVRISNRKIPPTDNVIAFKTMIEVDEDEFERIGNVYNAA